MEKDNKNTDKGIIGNSKSQETKETEILKHQKSFLVDETKQCESSSTDKVSMACSSKTTGDSSSHNIKQNIGQSIDAKQKLSSSSTIKTFYEDHTKSKESHMTIINPILKSKLVMPELGQINVIGFNVSHNHLDGIFFPETPIPIVGRISPDIVWEYYGINKIKKMKELIILRLAPATCADYEIYMSLFNYLSTRNKFGVLGGIRLPVKDVYLIPLNKHSSINKELLPFHGPGLPKRRSHCILAAVTRYSAQSIQSMMIKRHSLNNASSCETQSKNPKMSPSTSTETKGGVITSLQLGVVERMNKDEKISSATSSGDTLDVKNANLSDMDLLVKVPESKSKSESQNSLS